MKTIIDRIRSTTNQQAAAQQQGQWFPIQISPSAYAGEIFNVGVCFIDSNGMVHTKVAEDYSRLKCFYDDAINIDDVDLSVTMLREAINNAPYAEVKKMNVSGQLRFGMPAFAQGESVSAIVNRLFDKAVFIGKPRASEAAARFKTTSDSVARQRVIKLLQENHTDVAEGLLGNGRTVKFPFAQGEHAKSLSLDLRKEGKKAAMIATALLSDIDKVELRILRAWTTLQVLHEAVKNEDRALFLLRPGTQSGLPESTLTRHDDMLSEMDWKMKSEGILFRYETEPPALAQDIADWYGAKAS